jgi:hypothetical protein
MTSESVCIAPIVAWANRPILELVQYAQSNGEWDFCLAVKNEFLFNVKHWNCAGIYSVDGSVREIFFCPINSSQYISNTSDKEGLVLWGATARMVRNLVDLFE